jgi:hypothetical protein
VKQFDDEYREVSEARFYNLSHRKSEKLVADRAGADEVETSPGASQGDKPQELSIDQLVAAVKEFHPRHAEEVVKNENRKSPETQPPTAGTDDISSETASLAMGEESNIDPPEPEISDKPNEPEKYSRRSAIVDHFTSALLAAKG